MKLKFITCSGCNETTSIPELLNLLNEFPRAEIGVQVSNKKAAYGTPRYDWIYSLWGLLLHRRTTINAALHVNLQWVEDFGQGIVAPELEEFLLFDYNDDSPFFQRVQLNFKIGREKTPDIDKLEKVIRRFPRHRFILSYNQSNKRLIQELYIRNVKFDCLFDESFGAGIVPATRDEPAFIDVLQGYAGGITPDNVEQELHKIAQTNKKGYCMQDVYIDAHKGLEDEFTHFDINKCRAYLTNAENWYQNYLQSLKK
ncbi:MAG: hypothetical protein IJ532_05830 [Alphaproteobacteria bacterium]|nr:hypothetical protein [Alphaproteobacteria bacterium]